MVTSLSHEASLGGYENVCGSSPSECLKGRRPSSGSVPVVVRWSGSDGGPVHPCAPVVLPVRGDLGDLRQSDTSRPRMSGYYG